MSVAGSQLKECVENLGEMMDTMNDGAGVLEAFGLDSDYDTISEIVRMEIMRYWLYLSASDGVIDDEEVALLNEVFDHSFPAEAYKKLIIDCGIYSKEFEEQVPLLLHFAAYGEEWYKQHGHSFDVVDAVIRGYELFGKSLLSIDGSVDTSELADHTGYIEMLRAAAPQVKRNARARL